MKNQFVICALLASSQATRISAGPDELEIVTASILDNVETDSQKEFVQQEREYAKAHPAKEDVATTKSSIIVPAEPKYEMEYDNGDKMKVASKYAQTIGTQGQIGGVADFADGVAGSYVDFKMPEFDKDAYLQIAGPDGIVRPTDASGKPNPEIKDVSHIWKEFNRDILDSNLHKRSYQPPADNYEPYAGVQEGDAVGFDERPVAASWKKPEKEEVEKPGLSGAEEAKIEKAMKKVVEDKEEIKSNEEHKEAKEKEDKEKKAKEEKKNPPKELTAKAKAALKHTTKLQPEENEDEPRKVEKKEEKKEEKKDEKPEPAKKTVEEAKKGTSRPPSEQPKAAGAESLVQSSQEVYYNRNHGVWMKRAAGPALAQRPHYDGVNHLWLV